MLDYDREAARYDATRGGDARADAAAAAITGLLPAGAITIVDLACGTGIVTTRLAGPGREVLGVDRSAGMAAVTAGRMPGRIAVGDATRLPVASGSADAVIMVWLLHLLSWTASAQAVAEAARVLRPGGLLITTVNKNDASCHPEDDASLLVQAIRIEANEAPADDAGRVTAIGAEHGLVPTARAMFTGLGQGLSPRSRLEQLSGEHILWTRTVGTERMNDLYAELGGLPDQDRARPDPVYQVIALTKVTQAC